MDINVDKREEDEFEGYANEKLVPAEPPAEEKPVDINKEMQNNEDGKHVSEIMNSALNCGEEEYTEAKTTISQQSENMTRNGLEKLSKEALLAKLQSYQQMLENGTLEHTEFDRLRQEIMSRI